MIVCRAAITSNVSPLSVGKRHLCGDELQVTGIVVLPDEEALAGSDFLLEYRHAVIRYGGKKRQGKNSPHIQFANAESDAELIKFVQRFGPEVISSLRTEERSIPEVTDVPGVVHYDYSVDRTILVARRVLTHLRNAILVNTRGRNPSQPSM
jgi:hypothetical protein